MVALRIEYSKRRPGRTYWQALDRNKVVFATFEETIPSDGLKSERDFRANLLRDFVQQGFKVWHIKEKGSSNVEDQD